MNHELNEILRALQFEQSGDHFIPREPWPTMREDVAEAEQIVYEEWLKAGRGHLRLFRHYSLVGDTVDFSWAVWIERISQHFHRKHGPELGRTYALRILIMILSSGSEAPGN